MMKRDLRATVLVVDDEESVRSFVGSALGMAGCRVLLSKSGWESLSICREHDGPIDLALLDVVMPGMDGHQLREELLKLLPQIPILFMSGYPQNVVENSGVANFRDQFIQKPFSGPALLDQVEAILNQRASSVAANS